MVWACPRLLKNGASEPTTTKTQVEEGRIFINGTIFLANVIVFKGGLVAPFFAGQAVY